MTPGPVRLHVVTGKGGTGKTTVAGALALALAADGGDVLLVEVEGRQGIAQLFDTPPLPYAERRVAVAEGGGAVHALAIDPEEALLEYLELFYHLGRAGRGLRRMGIIEFATTVAPGIRDVLLTGKAYEAVRRRREGRYVFDAVVMDAPPTGRISRFLNVNAEVEHLARVGPIHTQAASMMRLFRSDWTAVHLVTQLEELPVQETLDGIDAVHAVGLGVGAVIVNADPAVPVPGAATSVIGSGAMTAPTPRMLAADLRSVGLPAGDTMISELLLLERARAAWAGEADACRGSLAQVGRPLVALPRLPGGVDVGGLFDLGDVLRAHLTALSDSDVADDHRGYTPRRPA